MPVFEVLLARGLTNSHCAHYSRFLTSSTGGEFARQTASDSLCQPSRQKARVMMMIGGVVSPLIY